MAERKKRQKANAGGMILAICPLCKGTGKVPKQLPFRANPRAPATRADRLGKETCPKCKGTGTVGGVGVITFALVLGGVGGGYLIFTRSRAMLR